ncbi:tail fiber assembly protein [Hafnia alvei]|uniref:tail fiber assembly protein n=1 Tax=Hafnia alvei TaxID=569 RepID=UPI0010338836|nr:tail fiber assembly protein [Hafnia alvei]TBL64104.1 tail fiber assembly protein [Hafnia alvei]
MNYFTDENTGEVYAYDDAQLSFVERINAPDFDNEQEQIPDIFFEIDEKIKGLRKMTQTEIDAHINPPVTREELIANAEAQKQRFIDEAEMKIAPLARAKRLGIATADELQQLDELERYSVLLSRIETASAPDIDWPPLPA